MLINPCFYNITVEHHNPDKSHDSGLSKRSLREEGMREQCIGEYSGVTRTLYLERCESGSGKVFWAGDRPPKDRTIVRIEDARVNLAIYIALVTVASFGIILATVFFIINIKFRNQRYTFQIIGTMIVQ